MRKSFPLFICFILFFQGISGQSLSIVALSSENSPFSMELDETVTGLCLRSTHEINWKELALFLDDTPLELRGNEHLDQRQTQLVTLRGKETLMIELPATQDTIDLILLNTGSSKVQLPKAKTETICTSPEAISQLLWRISPPPLPPPVVVPTETQVNHIIVHHSAGSNLASDYISEVRNIYTLHTQVNGWDDIGYNYLISPDGTLFLGRDPQGFMEQDNVRGAHMCGKNENTMAVCLLGNYEQVSPSDTMISTLYRLLAWKLTKEILAPFESTLHPIGPTSAKAPDAELAHIAGHKDGCIPGYTVCPGAFVYAKLDSIRSLTDQHMQGFCPVGLEEELVEILLPTVYHPGDALQVSSKTPPKIIGLDGRDYLAEKKNGAYHIPDHLHTGYFTLWTNLGGQRIWIQAHD